MYEFENPEQEVMFDYLKMQKPSLSLGLAIKQTVHLF